MKKRLLFCLPLSTLLLSGLFTIALSNRSAVTTSAIGNYSTDVATYYEDITATSGQQLAAQLHDLITSTHRYYTSYNDNGSNGYQKNTDQYYENGSKVNGYIYEFYSGAKWPNGWYPTEGNVNGGYNREHVWCQSNSKNEDGRQMWGDTGGGADMHHLRPVEVGLNSTRGNHPYGELGSIRDSYKKYADLGDQSSYLGGYYYNSIFEPIDSKKGDVARIVLYTYLHYNSYKVSSLFGSYGSTDGSTSYSSYFSSSLLSLTKITSETTEAKARDLLLKWNANDPVDDIERRRNEQVAVYQGNRNPFIDNSAYADAIWSDSVGIKSISKSTAELTTNETTTISAISSNGGNITWTTSNANVCSVSPTTSNSGSNITLTANGAGTATITAKITISGTTYSKKCEVTVSDPKTLASISIGNDVKTAYRVGDSFVRPTITANYTDSPNKDVTNSATFSGYDLTTTGSQTVTVSYTENGSTKSQTYDITVSEAVSVYYQKCTSFSDIENGGKYVIIGYKESTTQYYAMPSYTSGNNIPGVTVTLTENNTRLTQANMSTAAVYTLTSTGTANQYFIGDGSLYLYAAGSGTNNYLKGKSTTDSSAGAFTISYTTFFSVVAASNNRNTMRFNVSNNPPIFSCYSSNDSQTEVMFFKEVAAGPEPSEPTLTSISLNTTNVQTTFIVNDEFDYSGLLVTAHYSDDSSEDLDSYEVSNPDMSTTGQKTITVTYKDKTETYTITVNAGPNLSWTAPIINVFSGTVLSGSDVNDWGVIYDDGAGHQTVLTYSQFTVKIGDAAVSIPYTWSTEDDGKTITATYNSLATSQSTAVKVTQRVNTITGPVSEIYDYTFSSKQFDANESKTLSGHTWTLAGNGGYWGYDGTKGQQLGSSGNPYTNATLTCSDFLGTITSVSVYTSGASSINGTVQVSVGGTSYGNAGTLTSSNKAFNFTLGGKSGNVVISWTQTSSKALYIKEIVVRASGSAVISNSVSHISAQRVAVKFAKAFNAAMDTTSGCTTNLSTAWETCSTAYSTFLSEAAALGEAEEAYAKNLIKNATVQYSDNSGEACIERMLKTYEICVQKHGQTAFMSDLVTLTRFKNYSPLLVIKNNSHIVLIGVIIFIISISSIGGYFYIKRKKED